MLTNDFTAKCFRCGIRVPAGTGVLSFTTAEHFKHWPEFPRKTGRTASLVEHPECHEEFRGTFYHHIYQPRI